MLKSSISPTLMAFPVLLCLASCGRAQMAESAPPVESAAHGVIFSADGAGGFLVTSHCLKKAVEKVGLPLCVETVNWSHGVGRLLSDQVGHRHLRKSGQQLADQIAAYRAECPGRQVFVVAHSAGAAVALAAAEALPPNSIDRMILLAPSIASNYDLRPALRCTRCGIDVFYSARDWLYLGVGVGVTGTADRRWTAPAGRVGFRPTTRDAEDGGLYAKLSQHPWHSCLAWTGNHGGHYGAYRAKFLTAYVVPLLTCHRVEPIAAETDQER